MGEVILVASGKGGVGKSIFAANLAAILSQRNAKVALIDMNMGLRNLDLYMGLENRVVYDVADVLSGICRIKQALVRDRRFPELYLMSAARYKNTEGLNPSHMRGLCQSLKKDFDYIVVDAPAGIDRGLALAAAGADRAVIITVPEYAAIRDADMVDTILTGMGIKKKCYVINKLKVELFGKGWIPSLEEIAETMRVKMAGIIQYDDNIHIAANNGVPVVHKKDTYIWENFNQIADRVLEC